MNDSGESNQNRHMKAKSEGYNFRGIISRTREREVELELHRTAEHTFRFLQSVDRRLREVQDHRLGEICKH
jgi:hypothetical protein